jgi:hypothetical protein
VRMPTFSRHTGTTTAASDDEPTLTDTPTVPAGRHSDEPTLPIRQRTDEPTVAPPTGNRISTHRPNPPMTSPTAATIDRSAAERAEAAARAERTSAERAADRATNGADRETATAPPAVAGPRPRASLLATLGLITGVASALLVLSGPLAGYGIGLAVLALILSLGGISATGRRHVAGKSDALIGMVLALGAIVVGVLALTGSLSWLGTDMEPVSRAREWLDAQFIERF